MTGGHRPDRAAPMDPREFAALPYSRVLALAADDLECVSRDPAYRVDPVVWHRPGSDGCVVCAAGSVMAVTLGLSSDVEAVPEDMAGRLVPGTSAGSVDVRRALSRRLNFVSDIALAGLDGLDLGVATRVRGYTDDDRSAEAFRRALSTLEGRGLGEFYWDEGKGVPEVVSYLRAVSEALAGEGL